MTEQLEPETASKSEMETLSAEVENTHQPQRLMSHHLPMLPLANHLIIPLKGERAWEVGKAGLARRRIHCGIQPRNWLSEVRSGFTPETKASCEKSFNIIGVLYFRLGPATRQRLNIPVHIEVLDPTTNQCFGNPFSRYQRSFEQASIEIPVLQVYPWKLSWIWWCSDVFNQVSSREGRQQRLPEERGHWCPVSLCQPVGLLDLLCGGSSGHDYLHRLHLDATQVLRHFFTILLN